MGLVFEWDRRKARANERKHGVTFEEASSVFGDPLSITIRDELHSAEGDERLVTIGVSTTMRTVVVVHSECGDRIRIISARKATRRERMVYGQGDE